MVSTRIPFSIFRSFFNGSIRIQLNWERLKNEQITINLNIFDKLDHPSNWYLPWYFNDLDQEVNYSVQNASPLTLADIPKAINHFNNRRREKIKQLLSEFLKNTQQPVQVVIAAYALPNQKHLIIDGNHRSSALILAGVKAKLMVFEILGPLNQELIPDLCHWKK